MKVKDIPIPNIGLTELFLIEVFLYGLLWLISDYTATLVTIIFPILFAALLLFALAAELLQRSKVPRWYYWFMVLSIIAPLITALLFVYILGTDFDWTKI